MSLVPLYGFLAGDTLGLLVLADGDDTMDELADKLQRAAAVRVAPRTSVRVLIGGRTAPRQATVHSIGLAALDRFDVVDGPADPLRSTAEEVPA